MQSALHETSKASFFRHSCALQASPEKHVSEESPDRATTGLRSTGSRKSLEHTSCHCSWWRPAMQESTQLPKRTTTIKCRPWQHGLCPAGAESKAARAAAAAVASAQSSRNAHGHPIRAVLCEFTGKCRGTRSDTRRRLCASLRSRNAHDHLTRAILCANLQQKCRGARERTLI